MSGYVPNKPKDYEYKGIEPVDIHAEHWAQYEKYGKEPPPPPEKVKVALRIGVFFDGTGNSASNAATGALCGAHYPIDPKDIDSSCKSYMSDPDSSYGNDVSNVSKLFDLYYNSEELEGPGAQKVALRRVYVEGIGTRSGEEDSVLGAGTGRGETGVAGRVQLSFTLIKQEIIEVLRKNPDSEISALTFDTFGFSRGAAAARHFANQVICCKQGPLGEIMRALPKGFSKTFSGRYKSDINMGFIGLFDTVPSVAGLANLGNVKSAIAPGIKLHLHSRYFTDVVQLVARDECRANFALSRVGADHPEIELPGAHSDIGGGYLETADECVLVSPMQALEVSLTTDVKDTSIYRDAERVMTQWLAKGWPADMLEIVTPPSLNLPQEHQDRLSPARKRVYAALQLKRPISGHLSKVYLRVMYEQAKQKGVRFEEIDENEAHFALPTELQPLCDRFIAGDYSLTPAEETMLKLKYIHTSAHWNHPLGKRDGSGLKVFYINAPTADAVRMRHPHIPDWAL